MLSLMPFAKRVDVLGDDGMMRFGRVVDVTETGLFVDLLYPNRRREYVPFNRLFLPSETSFTAPSPMDSGEFFTAVEVLVPETPSGPLIWMSGESVGLWRREFVADYGGAIVHWRHKDSGVPCADFFPSQRIRWPQPLTMRREAGKDWRCMADDGPAGIGPGPFVKRTVPLNDDLRLVSSEEAEELIKRLNDSELRDFPFPCEVDVVELVDGRLGYVYQRDYREAYGVYDHKGGRLLTSLASFLSELRRLSPLLDEISTPCDEMPFGLELWQEVLSHLDTVTQMQLRAVCATWDQLIESPSLRGCITLGGYTGLKLRYAKYLRLAAVYKRLQPGTQHVLTQSDAGCLPLTTADLLMLYDMIRYVAQHRSGIRLRSLHMSRFQLNLRINAAAEHSGILKCILHQCDPATVQDIENGAYDQLKNIITVCCCLPCDTIYLTNCVVNLLCGRYSPDRYGWEVKTVHVKIDIPTARLPIDRDFRCALWETLEAALPVPNERELEDLRLRWGNEFQLKKIVCAMLCALQSTEPRPSAHYRGKKWCVDGLQSLRLEDLTHISRHFLVQLQRDTAW